MQQVVDSIPFSFPCSGNGGKARCQVSLLNMQCLKNLVESGEQKGVNGNGVS